MEDIEIPSHFICPISLQLMRDPVTVTTGITYDRGSIEKWLFVCKNNTCPMTKQVLTDFELTPNHTLRRLIQAWCMLNACYGIERIPTPKPQISKSQIFKFLDDVKKSPLHLQIKSLQNLKTVVLENERNKKYLEDNSSAIEFLASLVTKNNTNSNLVDEALSILFNLEISEKNMKNLVNRIDQEFVDSLIQILKCGNYQSRANGIKLLKSIYEVSDPIQLMGTRPELFNETARVFQDQISYQALKTGLKLLVELCPWGRNRIKAVQAGLVSVLIELLLETSDKKACELALVVLEQICRCAEGRAGLLDHAGGLAVVSKKIMRISHLASDRAVRILSSISKCSANAKVLHEMLQVGVVAKLCWVLEVETSVKTKERSREILRLHSRVWRNSSCIPSHLLSSYPSS
ncbi:U-box domain [Dillenia turbinata]|uniref:U-box domain-containing protein n=1 Tax=Dillenia turbinata TaxID=194707 RepID=A0AAN8V2Y6_9MAGN